MANQRMRAADYEYIAAHRGEMSERQLADALGVSKTTVHRAIRKLGLMTGGEPPKQPDGGVPEGIERASDRLVRLRGLANVLERSMRSAPPGALPAIAKEYRATLDEISALEGPGEEPEAPEAPKPEAKVTKFNAIRISRPALREAAEV